ncbi:MAG: hypothetical protein Q9193_005667 [Seirophora villosa]
MPRQYRRYTPFVRSTTWPHDAVHLKDLPTVLEQTKAHSSGSYLALKKQRVNFSSGRPAELPSLGHCSNSSLLFHCCVPLRSGGLCAQTLACQTHGLEAKKAVAGRKISEKAWVNLQDPGSYVRCRREGRQANKKRGAEAGSDHTCDTDTTSPAEVPEGQQYLDPVGVLLVMMVYSMLIAYALGVVSLERVLVKGEVWITARLKPAFVRRESLSERGSGSRISEERIKLGNAVEAVPKDLDLAVSRAINKAEELALEVEAYRREVAASPPPTISDAKEIGMEMEAAHRLAPPNGVDAKHVSAAEVEVDRRELKIHLPNVAAAPRETKERQDESRLGLDDVEGLRMVWDSKKTLEPVKDRDKVRDFFPFSAFQSEECGRVFGSCGYVYEGG